MAERKLYSKRQLLKFAAGAAAIAGVFPKTTEAQTSPERYTNGAPEIVDGVSSWYFCEGDVTEGVVKYLASGLQETGLWDVGFRNVNIDDGWTKGGEEGRVNGILVPDKNKFPRDIKPLADELREKGFGLGLYTDIGSETFLGKSGSYGHENSDVQTFISWGANFIKVDKSNKEERPHQERYPLFSQAILRSQMPVHLNLCNWGEEDVLNWGPSQAQSFRTGTDIDTFTYHRDNIWESIVDNYSANINQGKVIPGSDPDNLMVGRDKLTLEQERTQVLLWLIMGASFVLGCDPRNIHPEILNLLKNPLVTTIHKNMYGETTLVNSEIGNEILEKPLTQNTNAIVVFNRTSEPVQARVKWNQFMRTNSVYVRDPLNGTTTERSTGNLSLNLDSHAATLLLARAA